MVRESDIFQFAWLAEFIRTHYNLIVPISTGNHTNLSPIREIIVLAIVKIGRGEAESNFNYSVYNYSLIG